MKQPIIIDTDPGVDDFFCLSIGLAYSDQFNLLGITTMGGNNYTEVTTQNALDIVQLFKKDTPVISGSTSYLKAPFAKPEAEFHGANGLGDIELPHSKQLPLDISVEDFIYNAAKKYSKELILVTVAPLTNIARCFLKYPDVTKDIKKMVIMGGAIKGGNITPFAEANINHDAYAADIVFRSGVPIEMVGLDVTLKCPLELDVFDTISTNLSPEIKQVMQELITFRHGDPMHDAIAIASLVDDQMLTYKDAYVTIETKDSTHIGQTICDFDSSHPNCRVGISPNLQRYHDVMKGMCERS